MHHNHFEAIQVVQKLSYLLDKEDYDDVDVSRAPAVHRPALGADRASRPTTSRSRLGAQHCHWEDKGAFTGEVVAGHARQAQRRTT